MTNLKMRCDTCQFWDPKNTDAVFDTDGLDLGRCDKAMQLWDASEWSYDDDGERVLRTAKDAGQMMFVQDGSDYRADLYTKPGFFCAHFTAKP